jgi:acetoin utilization deacetylase AcuC-like enzyme
MTTLVLTHKDCLRHEPGEAHPEKPERLFKVLESLKRHGAADVIMSRAATLDMIAGAHDKRYIDKVVATAPREGIAALDEDTKMSPESLNAALAAAGTACHAVDLVLDGKARNVFCAVRPPGHHAFFDKSMGFCIFNNSAVAAAHAMQAHGLKRAAIVDFDVHHGNGTQDIVQRKLTDACFASLQEAKLWPYNDNDQISSGNIMNVGIERGAPAAVWHSYMDQKVIPLLRRYNPELLIISAGFDAHRDDPPEGILFNDPPGKQNLLDEDYARMTRALIALADECCGGRVVSCMEGGYNTDVLAGAAAAHVRAMAGIEQAEADAA